MTQVARMAAQAERQELEDRAQGLSSEIREGAQAIAKAWILMGERLYEFEQIDGWTLDGSSAESFKAWCGQPDCPVSYSYARQLIQIYRTYCVNFGLDVGDLQGAKVQNLLTGTKALKAGKAEDPADVVSDAQSLSESDFRLKWAENGRDDSTEMERCESCGSLVPKKAGA